MAIETGLSNDNIFSHINKEFKETFDHHESIKVTKFVESQSHT